MSPTFPPLNPLHPVPIQPPHSGPHHPIICAMGYAYSILFIQFYK